MNQQANLDAIRKRNKRTLILLMIVFLGPALIATIAYVFFKDDIRKLIKTSNYGTLVAKPFVLKAQGMQTPLDKKPVDEKYFFRKWTYVYIDNSSCDAMCIKNLKNQRAAELAQGKEARRVRRIFIVTDSSKLESLKEKMKDFTNLKIFTLDEAHKNQFLAQFNVAGGKPPSEAKRVYLVDPKGVLMMYYPSDTQIEYNPKLFKGMVNDLRTLLKRSMIG